VDLLLGRRRLLRGLAHAPAPTGSTR
jgi:hypothetical protein